jgi:hypothetical protein
MARPRQIRCVDSSQAEDDQIQRLVAAEREGLVRARLQTLPAAQVVILLLHYTGGSLPFSVDAASRATAALRRLCGLERMPTMQEARAALTKASPIERAKISEVSAGLVREAQLAYEHAEVQVSRRVQVHDPRGRDR